MNIKNPSLIPGAASVFHVEEPAHGEVALRSAILGHPAHVRRGHGQEGVALLKVRPGRLGLAVGAAAVLGGGAPAAGGVGAVGRRAAVGAAAELGVLAGAALLKGNMTRELYDRKKAKRIGALICWS